MVHVQCWESDSRKIFGKPFGPKVCKKVDFFQKLGLALGLGLGLGLGLAFQGEMTTFDEPDGVQGWESDSRRILGKPFGPKVCKKWTV